MWDWLNIKISLMTSERVGRNFPAACYKLAHYHHYGALFELMVVKSDGLNKIGWSKDIVENKIKKLSDNYRDLARIFFVEKVWSWSMQVLECFWTTKSQNSRDKNNNDTKQQRPQTTMTPNSNVTQQQWHQIAMTLNNKEIRLALNLKNKKNMFSKFPISFSNFHFKKPARNVSIKLKAVDYNIDLCINWIDTTKNKNTAQKRFNLLEPKSKYPGNYVNTDFFSNVMNLIFVLSKSIFHYVHAMLKNFGIDCSLVSISGNFVGQEGL